ncbi:hypothetical protein [Streptomyces sp. NBC_00306]|uniref:hypothetical protein n=1 Tax=Streptomyces sp. NBC_00306 TaxID=2975708 RepID=UPI002E294B4B|nr:hypothetical protein [Streptomyces sp. NBC_00306]
MQDAAPITAELWASGAEVRTWLLPDGCTGQEAAVLAELAVVGADWEELLTRAEVTVTAVRNAEILHSAVVPYVLPRLPIGALWLNLWETTAQDASILQQAAAEHGITFLNAIGSNPQSSPAPASSPHSCSTANTPTFPASKVRQSQSPELSTPRPGEAHTTPAGISTPSRNTSAAGTQSPLRDPTWDICGSDSTRRGEGGQFR